MREQRSPIKTTSMLGSLLASTAVSYLMQRLWTSGWLAVGGRDVFRCMGRESLSHPRTIVIGGADDDVISADVSANQEKEEEDGDATAAEALPLKEMVAKKVSGIDS